MHAMEESWHSEDEDQGSAVHARGNELSPSSWAAYELDTADHRRYNPYPVSRHIRHVFYRGRNIRFIRARSRIHPFYPVRTHEEYITYCKKEERWYSNVFAYNARSVLELF